MADDPKISASDVENMAKARGLTKDMLETWRESANAAERMNDSVEDLTDSLQRVLKFSDAQAKIVNQSVNKFQELATRAGDLNGTIQNLVDPTKMMYELFARSVDRFIELDNAALKFRETTGFLSSQTKQVEENMNGIDRTDTDKNIRRLIGTVDDFMLTSVATQFSAQSFIGEGSTNRKTILAKFLDLDIFEAKFKAAKGESAEIKALLKKLEGQDHDEIIKNLKESMKKAELGISIVSEELKENQKFLNEKRQQLFAAQAEIKSISTNNKNYTSVILNKDQYNVTKEQLEKKNVTCQGEIKSLKQQIDNLEGDLSIQIEDYLNKQAQIDAADKTIQQLIASRKLAELKDGEYSRQISVLSEVPCGSEYSHCKFIKDAYSAKEEKPEIEGQLVQINTNINKIREEYKNVDTISIHTAINKYNSALALKHKYEMSIKNLEVSIEKNNTKIQSCIDSIERCDEYLKGYDEDLELLNKLHDLTENESSLKKEVVEYEMKVSSTQNQVTTLYKDIGYLVSQLEKAEEDKQELSEKRKEFAAYDLYLKAMHPNGISYQVIKNKLPVINEEINKTLTNIVDFQVYLINDDDKLDIMIKHPNYDARPLEMGSGAEKSLASIAIRLAFLSVTSLPKCDIFILDEPGTSLDADNLSGFIRILDLIKNSFKTVILISHLDALKDAVDMQIVIDKKGNYAFVNQ